MRLLRRQFNYGTIGKGNNRQHHLALILKRDIRIRHLRPLGAVLRSFEATPKGPSLDLHR